MIHFLITDVYGFPVRCTVRCTDQNWYAHILFRHSEMVGMEDMVIRTIEAPWQVRQDVEFDNRECFYRPKDVYYGKRQYVKVVVEYHGFWPFGTKGDVVTAYITDEVRRDEKLLRRGPFEWL